MKALRVGVFLFSFVLCCESASFAGVRGKDCSPRLQEVQERVLTYAGYDRHDFNRWKKRSRWAAALPRLQFGFDRDLKSVASLSTEDNISISGGDVTVGPQESHLNQNFNSGTSFDVKVVWELGELIFNRDELNISAMARSWVRERNILMTDVEETYFERQRLLKRMKKIHSSLKKEAFEMRIQELNGHLDGLTGGWFTRQCSYEL